MGPPLALGNSVWEVLGAAFIVLVPTLPATYLLWRAVGGRRSRRGQEIESGRSAATPFAVISLVGSAILAAAVAVTLVVVAVRALAA